MYCCDVSNPDVNSYFCRAQWLTYMCSSCRHGNDGSYVLKAARKWDYKFDYIKITYFDNRFTLKKNHIGHLKNHHHLDISNSISVYQV